MLTVLAPAKINLTLEVLSRRADGFHEIRSVIQTMNLCDTLEFRLSQGVRVRSSAADWVAERSLVTKAVDLLQTVTGCAKGVTIDVTKRIPLSSGLGGDSTDAAAALRGLNELWELHLPQGKLLELAARLGSDVVFFIYGGTALIEGGGEKVTQLPALPRTGAILAVPPLPRPPGKTAQLYASLNANHYTDGQITQRLVAALREGRGLSPSLLFNAFENVAFDHFPGLKSYWEHMVKLGAANIHLAGSGPALFSLVKDKAKAEELFVRCRQQGMETYLAETG